MSVAGRQTLRSGRTAECQPTRTGLHSLRLPGSHRSAGMGSAHLVRELSSL